MKKNATVYVSGLLKLRPSAHQFQKVTQKEFWAALSLVQFPLRIDTRLDESHGLVNYYIPHDRMEDFRKAGLKTPQLAYIHKGDYVLHIFMIQALQRHLPTHVLNVLKMQVIKRSLPELLEMIGVPLTRPTPNKS